MYLQTLSVSLIDWLISIINISNFTLQRVTVPTMTRFTRMVWNGVLDVTCVVIVIMVKSHVIIYVVHHQGNHQKIVCILYKSVYRILAVKNGSALMVSSCMPVEQWVDSYIQLSYFELFTANFKIARFFDRSWVVICPMAWCSVAKKGWVGFRGIASGSEMSRAHWIGRFSIYVVCNCQKLIQDDKT